MHIPPYHKKSSWQRFFFGAFIGGVIAYILLLYMYGAMYESLLEENLELNMMVTDLQSQNDALLSESSKRDAPPMIQEIEILFVNENSIKSDKLLLSQLQAVIKKEIEHLIGTEVKIVSASEDLLVSAIENKSFKIDNINYRFTVFSLTITEKLRLRLEIEPFD